MMMRSGSSILIGGGLPTTLGLLWLLGSGEPLDCTEWGGSIGNPLKQSFSGTEVIGNVEVLGEQRILLKCKGL